MHLTKLFLSAFEYNDSFQFLCPDSIGPRFLSSVSQNHKVFLQTKKISTGKFFNLHLPCCARVSHFFYIYSCLLILSCTLKARNFIY